MHDGHTGTSCGSFTLKVGPPCCCCCREAGPGCWGGGAAGAFLRLRSASYATRFMWLCTATASCCRCTHRRSVKAALKLLNI